MNTRHVKISAPAHAGYATAVEVDGQPVEGVRAVTFTSDVNEVNKVTLDLILFTSEVDGQAIVEIPEETRKALALLGWTPPAGPCACPILDFTKPGGPPTFMRGAPVAWCEPHGADIRAAIAAARDAA